MTDQELIHIQEGRIKILEENLEILLELLEQNDGFDRKEFDKFVRINQRMRRKAFLEKCLNPSRCQGDA